MMGSEAVSTAERNGVQVVHRTAAILNSLRGEPDGLSLSQIAERVGLARSTVHRLVAALEQERFVVAATSSRGFRLGPALASLAWATSNNVTALIHPFLIELSQELNETVDLAVLEHDHVLFVDQVPAAARRLRAVSAVGAVFPVHCTANGKALLAQLSDAEIERLLPARLEPLTPQTVRHPRRAARGAGGRPPRRRRLRPRGAHPRHLRGRHRARHTRRPGGRDHRAAARAALPGERDPDRGRAAAHARRDQPGARVNGKIAVEEHFVTPELEEMIFGVGWAPEDWRRVVRRLAGRRRAARRDGPARDRDRRRSRSARSASRTSSTRRARSSRHAARTTHSPSSCAAHPTRFAGLAALPMQDPAAAADELERCRRRARPQGRARQRLLEPRRPRDRRLLRRRRVPAVLGAGRGARRPLLPAPAQPAAEPAPRSTTAASELLGPTWAFAVETGTHALRLLDERPLRPVPRPDDHPRPHRRVPAVRAQPARAADLAHPPRPARKAGAAVSCATTSTSRPAATTTPRR